MKYLLLAIACIVASFAPIFGVQGQTTNPSYIPTITPKAPDASALMKFNDIPVSSYTGASSVAVPLYTIKMKGMTIPISIDYHTGGIRLEEEASSCGLGWALNAGGMISRTINDKDDLGGLYFGQPVPQIQGNLIGYQPANGVPPNLSDAQLDSTVSYQCPTCSAYNQCLTCPINGNRYTFDFNCSYLVNFTGGTGDYTNPFVPRGDSPPYDMEPDTYSYSFLGKSGKFIIKRDKHSVVLEKQDNVNIQVVWPANLLASGIYFIITDESGNKFYFNQTQATYPAWQSGATPTSWYLTAIITQQNDRITFNYGGNNITNPHPFTSVAAESSQIYGAFGSTNGTLTNISSTGTAYNNINLQSIDYADGQVQFYLDGNREDLSGGIKLDSLRIYSKTTAGLNYLKSEKLYYSYFNPGTASLELERLKLDSVKEQSGGNALKPYAFYYNPAPPSLGEKHSFAIDHWGFYNGAGNTVLIPTTADYYMGNGFSAGPSYFTFTGANRETSLYENFQYFVLNRVKYPTGGSSTFSYETNTYDYNKSASILTAPQQVIVTVDTAFNFNSTSFASSNTLTGVIDFSDIYQTIPVGEAGNNATINVAFVSNYYPQNGQTAWPSADFNTNGKLYFEFGTNITDINETQSNCGGPQCGLSYPVAISQRTTYPWTAHYESSAIPLADFSEIRVVVTWQEVETVAANNPTLTAGGLRIHSIIDSTATGIAKERVWNYNDASGSHSNGILMSFPSYEHYEEQQNVQGGQTPALVLFSSSNTPTTSTIGGNIIGYSQVTETTIDPSNNLDNGKIVYNYINTADTVIDYNMLRMPGIPNMGNNLNGSELSRITYRNTGNSYWKVAETDNFYHTANRSVYYSAKYRSGQMVNNIGYCPGGTPVENQGIALFFPSIKSERVLLDSTRNITYDPADTTQSQVSSTKTFYDNPVHYLPTRTRMTDSRGDIHVSKITYPQDYLPTLTATATGNAILDTLIAHNMVAENIEKRDSLIYKGSTTGYVTAATQTRYKQLPPPPPTIPVTPAPMVQDKIYRLDITNPVTNFVPVSVSGNTYNQDSRYRQLISFDSYDAANNISQYTPANELPVSIIWDYRHVSPIAQVKNAALTDAAYTSFEADGAGSWTVGSAIRDSVTAAITGTKSYNIALGLSKNGLTAATTYVVSYWTKSSAALTIAGTITGYPVKGATINGWTYYEHKVTGQTIISITGTGNIDEVRLYPQNVEMTSYTYNPQIGVSSTNDAKAGINYYEYDNFQRLMNIKDQYGNIVKHIDYHYAGQ